MAGACDFVEVEHLWVRLLHHWTLNCSSAGGSEVTQSVRLIQSFKNPAGGNSLQLLTQTSSSLCACWTFFHFSPQWHNNHFQVMQHELRRPCWRSSALFYHTKLPSQLSVLNSWDFRAEVWFSLLWINTETHSLLRSASGPSARFWWKTKWLLTNRAERTIVSWTFFLPRDFQFGSILQTAVMKVRTNTDIINNIIFITNKGSLWKTEFPVELNWSIGMINTIGRATFSRMGI